MSKKDTKYIITHHAGTYTSREYKSSPLTIAEAVQYYGYTLEVGASWAHEKGNKKINRYPTTLKSLLTNLFSAPQLPLYPASHHALLRSIFPPIPDIFPPTMETL